MANNSLRKLLLCALALLGAVAALGEPAEAPARGTRANVLPADYLVAEIDRFRTETWRWQQLMGKTRTRTTFSTRSPRARAYRHWILGLWRTRARNARGEAANPPRKTAWLCIYRHERHPRQGWSTNTGNGYFGGLQMDLSFQRAYGRELLNRKGTADNWTATEQIWVAERAFREGRHFYPWPNSARSCGLI